MKYLVMGIAMAMTSVSIANDELDQRISFYVTQFNLKALEKPTGKKQALFEFGKKLFHEEDLSGNRNISCATCHSPDSHGVDNIPFAKGEAKKILGRNTPHIFNLENDNVIEMMFWDIRVRFDKRDNTFVSPFEFFNGKEPRRKDITNVLTSAASMQALFPIMSRDEMRGQPGDSELSDLEDPEEIFLALEKRIYEGENGEEYEKLFKKAYPNVEKSKRNIGHIMEAIAHFEIHQFSVTNTPWDKYLRGEKSALTKLQKEGALIFFEDGQCIKCHNTDHLGGSEVHNIGTPQIGFNKDAIDVGAEAVTGNEMHRFMFKTPSLRNVAHTAPYMHNGAYMTLEQVVDHYISPLDSAPKYTINEILNDIFSDDYGIDIIVTNANEQVTKRLSHKLPILGGLLDMDQRDALVEFLKNSLSE